MQPINARAQDMFNQINRHVDFNNKLVIDIGSGHCDLAMRAIDAGAKQVICLEKSREIIKSVSNRIRGTSYGMRLFFVNDTIERALLSSRSNAYNPDIAICTSVLPYLSEPDALLNWMSTKACMSIIECQYINDGPGSNLGIEDDAMMESWLRTFEAWDSKNNCRKIGETEIVIRPGSRSIWLCTSLLHYPLQLNERV